MNMLELESSDLESWKYLSEGNFTITTNPVPFTSIDPDHAIEHQHKLIKSGKVQLLDRISPHNDKIGPDKICPTKYSLFQQGSSSIINTYIKNAQNLASVLIREGNPFEYQDLRNLINFSVPRTAICYDVCHRDKRGIEALKKFRDERMVEGNDNDENVDSIAFWSTLPKNNLQMFSDIHIVINEKQKTLTTLKKEKQLYARMLVALKARPELSPEKIIGEFEFTNIPPSNFSPDGEMITVKSNDPLMNLIMARPNSENETTDFYERPTEEDSVIIFNATEILEIVKKKKPMEKRLNDNNAKATNQKKAVIHYHVKSTTPMKNFDNFFAHTDTRIELCAFLGQAVLEHFKESKIKHLVAYGNKYFVSKSLAAETTLAMEHEYTETKQIILSNVADISKLYRNRKLTIYSEDIDLAVLLIGLFNQIPPYTKIKWNRKTIRIIDLYSRLGNRLSEAIIGWYVFNGNSLVFKSYILAKCLDVDNIPYLLETTLSKVNKKGVKTQFQAFLKADDDIIFAFRQFGESSEIPEGLLMQIERFVCLMYSKKAGKNIKELRFLLSGDGKDGNQLPPTVGTLIPHLHRAYYQALIYKVSIKSNPVIPPPTNYFGEISSEGNFVPLRCVTGVNPPAPSAILE
ncbi:hypothetical protein Bhyg_03346 [Pseudolycoriella hygida]|uniref:Uncharacterized protein n=1 Tax=Pseudolycoriella hygida TaxID=35572 RepID=A0A9Q0NEP9_9DIPT|nr:hypothetical protein Bhyg_03346 [Pseudolycoriella hygida]